MSTHYWERQSDPILASFYMHTRPATEGRLDLQKRDQLFPCEIKGQAQVTILTEGAGMSINASISPQWGNGKQEFPV